jgi:hypothetical protein
MVRESPRLALSSSFSGLSKQIRKTANEIRRSYV